MAAKRKISPGDAEVLSVWESLLPINVLRLHQRLLPDSVTLPKRTATKAEMLKFYHQMQPPEIRELVEAVRRLDYPVLDLRYLAEQLTSKGGRLKESGRNLISSLKATDFPLKSISYTLSVAQMRTLTAMFRGCAQSYSSCLKDAKSEREEEKCERAYRGCAAIWELQIWIIMIREWLPELFPPRPRPPWADPPPNPRPPWI